MLEIIVAIIAGLFLLWVCCTESTEKPDRFQIKATQDKRYFEVIDNETGKVKHIGTQEDCEKWVALRNSKK
jgi:hypothetical protein